MENRMVIEIAGNELQIVSDQSPEVMLKTASFVQDKIKRLMGGSKLTTSVAAILTAMNITEELESEAQASDRLRKEITVYAKENADCKNAIEALAAEKEELSRALENIKMDLKIKQSTVQAMDEKDEALFNVQQKLDAAVSENESLQHRLTELQSKWEAVMRELNELRQRESAAGALGGELSELRREASQLRQKQELADEELNRLRQSSGFREEAYQKEKEELLRELSEYKELAALLEEENEDQQSFDDEEEESKAELLEYKAKYEELVEEMESFKINYALKSNELERLKKQLHR